MSNGIQEIASVLVGHGFTPVAAAGIIGNAYQESSWNPSSVGDGGGGLWGFTAAPNSLADLYHYAASTGQNWRDPKTQTSFLIQHISASTKATLNSIKDPAAAASYFMNNWEHPLASSENEARRQQGAQIAYHQISGANLVSAGGTNKGNKQIAKSRSTGASTTTTTTTGTSAKAAALSALIGGLGSGTTMSVPITSPVKTSIPAVTEVKIT